MARQRLSDRKAERLSIKHGIDFATVASVWTRGDRRELLVVFKSGDSKMVKTGKAYHRSTASGPTDQIT